MSRHARTLALSLFATCALAACKPAAAPATDAGTTATATSAAAASTAGPSAAVSPAAPSAIAKVAASLDPLASPKDAIKASMDKFLAVHSYHATMEVEGGPRPGHNEIDFVAPDRYRMQMSMGTQFIIGDTMYMQVRGGKTMKVPMPAGTLGQWRDPARLAEAEAGMTVQAQGSDTIDGMSTRKYQVHHEQPHPSDMTIWINDDDLPVRIRVDNLMHGKMSSTVSYSRFDDPSIRIDPPQ